MDYTSCSSAIILKDAILYFRTCSLESTQDDNHLNHTVIDQIFKDSVTFGITAANADNGKSSRVKNCLSNKALYGELLKINGAEVRNGFCFLEDGTEELERGFVVSIPALQSESTGDSVAVDAIPRLSKKYKQTYYYRYSYREGRVIQELVRTEGNKVTDVSMVLPVPPPTLHPAFLTPTSCAVFHKAADAVHILSELETPEAEEILQIAEANTRAMEQRCDLRHPFIVIEGMDATGKTTLTSKLRERMKATTLRSPPDVLRPLRSYFDDQPELIRRAYYTIGNYIVAQQIQQATEDNPVVMDRFWQSTAVYNIATETAGGDVSSLPPAGHWVYQWPEDMVKPDLVLFLTVSEEVRYQRLQSRGEEITPEEILQHESLFFRKRLMEAYRRMTNPGVIEIDAAPSREIVMECAMKHIGKLL